jgi:hypothetical protein
MRGAARRTGSLPLARRRIGLAHAELRALLAELRLELADAKTRLVCLDNDGEGSFDFLSFHHRMRDAIAGTRSPGQHGKFSTGGVPTRACRGAHGLVRWATGEERRAAAKPGRAGHELVGTDVRTRGVRLE